MYYTVWYFLNFCLIINIVQHYFSPNVSIFTETFNFKISMTVF